MIYAATGEKQEGPRMGATGPRSLGDGRLGPIARHGGGKGSLPLTAREIEVMRCLAQGLSKPATARALGISPHTVNRHTTNLMSKLNVHNRAELTQVAIREGLITA